MNLSPIRSHRALAALMAALLVIQPLVAASSEMEPSRPTVPPQLEFQVDDLNVRVDYADYLANAERFARSESAGFSVHLDVAPLHEDSSAPEGSDWERRLTQSWFRDAVHLRTVLTSADDRLSVEIPWSWMTDVDGAGRSEPAWISINGERFSLRQETVHRMISDLSTRKAVDPALLEGELAPLRQARVALTLQTVSSLELLRQAELRVREDHRPPGFVRPLATGCAQVCLGCAIALATSLVGTAALVLPCGGSVLSGGLALPACLAAIVGLVLTQGMTFVRCEACVACVQDPDPPGICCPDPSEPGGVCPEDYHECCGNQCCSDQSPPPDCDD